MSELWQLSGGAVSRKVRSGEVSAVDVAKSALARLDAVNPKLNAVVQQLPDQALAQAASIDAEIARGKDPGPLAGVPVTIKVNVDQQGFATTNGLKLQENLVAETDSPVVANLRKAGAIVVGRTNTPAFSLRWFTRNNLHGSTYNPHNKSLTPGGSSGGAASATAAGIGAIGHGTDIAGSVRYPAYACGLHGLRPSLGRIPAVNLSAADRHIGAQLMAVSGPLARTVEDVRLGFEAMAAADTSDPWWVPVPLSLPDQPKRVALCLEPSDMKVDSAVKDALRDAARRLADAGYQVDEVECPDMREPTQMQLILWLAEFRRGAAAAVEQEGDPDSQFVYAQLQRHCPAPDLDMVMDCLQRRVTLGRQWNAFFEQYPLILCPISGEPPFPNNLDVESEDSFDRVAEAQVPQIGPPFLGLPGLCVTTGISDQNVPMGVQLIAARYREDTLLAAGAAIEAAGPALPPIDPTW
ncbi:MAG: amidase family protein [Rhizobiaceae bacterium]